MRSKCDAKLMTMNSYYWILSRLEFIGIFILVGDNGKKNNPVDYLSLDGHLVLR